MSKYEGTNNEKRNKSKTVITILIVIIAILAIALAAMLFANSNRTSNSPSASTTVSTTDEITETVNTEDLHPGEITFYNGSTLKIGDKFLTAKDTGFDCEGIDNKIPKEDLDFGNCDFIINDDKYFDGDIGELHLDSYREKNAGDVYADMIIDYIGVEMENFETAKTDISVLGGISTDTTISQIEKILKNAGLKKDESYDFEKENSQLGDNTYAIYTREEDTIVYVNVIDNKGINYYYYIYQSVNEDNNITFNNIDICKYPVN